MAPLVFGVSPMEQCCASSRAQALLSPGFLRTAKLLVTASGAINFWRVSDGMLLSSYGQAGATCLAIAPNGKWFAYGRGDGTVLVARMPLLVNQIQHVANKVVISWQGGSGLYQLQTCTNLAEGTWQPAGFSTTATRATKRRFWNGLLPCFKVCQIRSRLFVISRSNNGVVPPYEQHRMLHLSGCTVEAAAILDGSRSAAMSGCAPRINGAQNCVSPACNETDIVARNRNWGRSGWS